MIFQSRLQKNVSQTGFKMLEVFEGARKHDPHLVELPQGRKVLKGHSLGDSN